VHQARHQSRSLTTNNLVAFPRRADLGHRRQSERPVPNVDGRKLGDRDPTSAEDRVKRWEMKMSSDILASRWLRYWIFATIAAGSVAAASSASAFGLSDDDYLYLAKVQHVERSDAPVLDISPLERTRLHNLINDPRTAGNPVVRDKDVKDALDELLAHQIWEKSHPGRLWDDPRRESGSHNSAHE
jgi:hypothetical protein